MLKFLGLGSRERAPRVPLRREGTGEVQRIGQFATSWFEGRAYSVWLMVLKGDGRLFRFEARDFGATVVALTKIGDTVQIATEGERLIEFVNMTLAQE